MSVCDDLVLFFYILKMLSFQAFQASKLFCLFLVVLMFTDVIINFTPSLKQESSVRCPVHHMANILYRDKQPRTPKMKPVCTKTISQRE